MESVDNVSQKLYGSTIRGKWHFSKWERKLLSGEGGGGLNDVRYMELSFNMRLQVWLDQPSLPPQSHLQWISTRTILCDPNAFFIAF